MVILCTNLWLLKYLIITQLHICITNMHMHSVFLLRTNVFAGGVAVKPAVQVDIHMYMTFMFRILLS